MLDTGWAIKVSEEAAQLAGCLVTPPLHFGWSSGHMAYPGCIGLRAETLTAVAMDIAHSLLHQGFRRIVFVNGNRVANLPPLEIAAVKLRVETGAAVAVADCGLLAREAVAGLPDAFAQAVALDWGPLSDRLARAASAYVLGRGPGYAIACEAALKMKETSGLHAEAYSAAEVLHGPSAIVQGRFPVLALGVEDAALPQLIATAARLAGQGADVFVTGAEVPGAATLPTVAGLHPMVAPLVLVASFYPFVEGLARRRGFDPDVPPHLRKVTETL